MEFLGIGPSELAFIVIIALIVLGPKDMQKAGRTMGKWLRLLVTSEGWKLFQQTSREIQTLPNRLMREAAFDELKDLQKDLGKPLHAGNFLSDTAASITPQAEDVNLPAINPASESDNKILPPSPSNTPSVHDEEKNE